MTKQEQMALLSSIRRNGGTCKHSTALGRRSIALECGECPIHDSCMGNATRDTWAKYWLRDNVNPKLGLI